MFKFLTKTLCLGIVPVMIFAASGSLPGTQSTDSSSAPQKSAGECYSPYALCAQALCKVDASGNTAECICPVKKGENTAAAIPCAERKAVVQQGQVYSTYSASSVDTNSKFINEVIYDPGTICENVNGNSPMYYASCVDVLCQIDQKNPNKAICPCPMKHTAFKKGVIFSEAPNCLSAAERCKYLTNDGVATTNEGTILAVVGAKISNPDISSADFCRPDKN